MSELTRSITLSLLLLVLMPAQGELRDPTEPHGFRQAQPGGSVTAATPIFDANSLRLSGIFIGPDGNSAVINGHRLRVGDRIAGAQLVNIEPHRIEVDLEGDRIKIELLPISVKTPAKLFSGGGE